MKITLSVGTNTYVIEVEVIDIPPPVAPSVLSPGWISRFKSPVPPGWNTVLGYLAETNPEALFLMDPDAEATQRDGWWLTNQCRRECIVPIKVQAPAHLLQQGIFTVNAYPLRLLQQRLG
jgi:hypothetical protein